MNIKVRGGQVLSGEITPSGSKNSAMAIIPATILFDKPITLQNVPEITDVTRLVGIMEKLGSKIDWDKTKGVMTIDNTNLSVQDLDKSDLGNMKGTSLFWGPMLARFKKVVFKDLPGGCTLGFRTLDPHYTAFRDLGVVVNDSENSVGMDASQAKAKEIWLTEMSPTTTENIVTLAVSLEGKTKIVGAASEPQVQDLCNFLVKGGAEINGIGSSILEISGGKTLFPVGHELLSDHYEITTFIALAAITGGSIRIKKALPGLIDNILYVFRRFGLSTSYEGEDLVIQGGQEIIVKEDEGRGVLVVRAQPWPGLPVDTLPLFIPLALAAKKGEVLFHNWMYDAGLFWTSELHKYGGNIVMCDPHRVMVICGNNLKGATIEAPYIIRAVVALAMTAMIAQGESVILNADALYRGHPKFAENLRSLGAIIEEV